MCRPVVCKKCAKTTWAGCGMHVADVQRNVAPENWCDGQHDSTSTPADTAPTGTLTPGRGLLGWLKRN